MEVGNIVFSLDGSDAIKTNGLVSWQYEKPVAVKIWNKGKQPNPSYAKPGDAGMDLRANEEVKIWPGEIALVKTGIHISLPSGYEVQVRPRSGQSAKTKIRIANAPGTIDSEYRGEICVICDNIGDEPYTIKEGDRIAQIVLQKVPTIGWVSVDTEEELGETTRGSSGFGSSGHN